MLRFRRYREFVVLTLLIGFLLYLNLFRGVEFAASPEPKALDFVHEAKQAPRQRQARPDPGPGPGLSQDRPAPVRPVGGSNGRPRIPSDGDAPTKPLHLEDIGIDLSPVITDNAPSPPRGPVVPTAPAPAPALAQGADEIPLDDSSRTDTAEMTKQQKQAPDRIWKPGEESVAVTVHPDLSIQTADASLPADRPTLARPERFPATSTRALPRGTPLKLPRIQFDFSDVQESGDAKAARLEKLDVIKDATIQTWKQYRKQAWLHDEVKPNSGGWRDPFGGLAATLVDSLDTLYIMGLDREFQEAVTAVSQLDFRAYAKDDIPLFEVVIRYLGGLLGAYDISGGKHDVLLTKAADLGDYLLAAFDTPNHMPILKWDHRTRKQHGATDHSNLAETGSLLVEFTRLAQLTNENRFYNVVARIAEALQNVQDDTNLPGMWSLDLDISGCNRSVLTSATEKLAEPTIGGPEPIRPDNVSRRSKAADGNDETSLGKRQLDLAQGSDARMPPATTTTKNDRCVKQDPIVEITNRDGVFVYSLGSRADSTYEYLPKEYVLLGGLEKSFETMYTRAIDVASGFLLYKPMTPDGADILFSGKLGVEPESIDKHHFLADATHLGCFAGGMYAYGAKLFDRPEDLSIAKKLTEGCVWAYSVTPTGIMPEEMVLSRCENAKTCVWDEAKMENDKAYDKSRKVFGTAAGNGYPGKMPAGKPIARERKTESILEEPVTDASVEPEHVFRDGKSAEPEHVFRDGKSADDGRGARSGGASKDPPPHHDPSTHELEKRQLADFDEENEEETGKSKRRKESYEEAEFYKSQGEISGTQNDKVTLDDNTKVAVEDDDLTGGLKAKLADPARIADVNPERIKPDRSADGADAKQRAGTDSTEGSAAGQTSQDPDDKTLSRGQKKSKPDPLPKGVVSIRASEYKLRPEAIESVWYMYRITGDEHWRKVGWQMWQAVEKATSTKYGFSAIDDVNSERVVLSDKMESFWVAETLKYFYLLFTDADVVSLDEYVLNTEAHPLRRPVVRSE